MVGVIDALMFARKFRAAAPRFCHRRGCPRATVEASPRELRHRDRPSAFSTFPLTKKRTTSDPPATFMLY
jgi:hypothetical protein